MSAKNAMERVIQNGSRRRFLFFFRSSVDLNELKSYQDKLKTLCPILSLAITTNTQQIQEERQQKENASNQAGGQGGFNASRLLKSDEANEFWNLHFGAQASSTTQVPYEPN